MLNFLRTQVPASLKRTAGRRVIDPLMRGINDWHLSRWIREFRRNSRLTENSLQSLRHVWGNKGFSADETYIAEVISRVESARGPILECGSGITTLVAGLVAEKRGLVVWSLEQDQDWAHFVNQRLKQNGIQNVELRYAPLKKYDGFVWYEIDSLKLPRHFDLVLCDGPAVFEQWGRAHKQWRYGVVPVLADHGISLGEILLDDSTEPRSENVLYRWQQEFGLGSSLISSIHGDCALVQQEV